MPDPENPSEENHNTSLLPTAILFVSGLPIILTSINFLGTYLGYAYMLELGIHFQPQQNTNQTTNQTNVSQHPICGTAHHNWVNPNGFAAIAAISTFTTFALFVFASLFFQLAWSERKTIKHQLHGYAAYAVAMNVPAAALMPATAGFFVTCFRLIDALRLAGATFFGSNSIMLGIALIIMCGRTSKKCCPQETTEVTPTNRIQVVPHRLSSSSLVSFQGQTSSLFNASTQSQSPASQSVNPLGSSLHLESPNNTAQSPGHRRTDTQHTQPYSEERLQA
ncbi:MAG: hypothetical protein COY58_04030 [Gammaproteobacteria bacterium CG_4_10_14_0_8_um_filter_38_16]|nr:MAG: hypothetical protein COY58_04030 [Gammaproteobacteria bacterium CG_4_10_14_0_8_um_filter_38_16]PJA02716.1 MAG: hypothetical protein COX72_08865 [Gammaproteobacteria bacterium CG_4_10_14_0_2_um_filter_38_22]PJB09794.1 MAG: hypothetical protein CO120_08155 [Gammaproteobacteria bacterium CG_4_9_14_3_um_filter_38_9]